MHSTSVVKTEEAREIIVSGSVATPATEIAVVLPTLNEEKAVGYVLDSIHEVLKGRDYRIIVVDGNSTDATVNIAEDRGAEVIQQRQRGYGDALHTGFEYAHKKLGAQVAVMMDPDGTYDPNDMPKLIEPIIKDEADVVVGNRFQGLEEGAMTSTNRIGNRLISWAARRMLKIRTYDTQSGFRAINAKILRHLDLKASGMPFAIEMLAEANQANAKIIERPVSYRQRIGETKLSPLKDGFRIFVAILRLARDYQPLLFFGGAGLLFILGGLLFGAKVVIEWLLTGEITHLASVILSSLLVISGLQLLFTALLADMIKNSRRHPRIE